MHVSAMSHCLTDVWLFWHLAIQHTILRTQRFMGIATLAYSYADLLPLEHLTPRTNDLTWIQPCNQPVLRLPEHTAPSPRVSFFSNSNRILIDLRFTIWFCICHRVSSRSLFLYLCFDLCLNVRNLSLQSSPFKHGLRSIALFYGATFAINIFSVFYDSSQSKYHSSLHAMKVLCQTPAKNIFGFYCN